MPRSVLEHLEALVRTKGNEPGFIDAGTGDTVTWSDVARQAIEWRGTFPGGAVVGLQTKSAITFCCAYLAALSSGVCVSPLDPRATPGEVEVAARALGLTDLVTDVPSREETPRPPLNLWISSPNGPVRIGPERRPRHPDPTAPAAVLLTTSGTTGRPKVVPLQEAQLLRSAARIAIHHDIRSGDRGYCPLPLCHINAQVVGILTTLVTGGALIVEDRFHRDHFWARAEDLGATWLNLVPAILAMLNDESPPNDEATRRIRFARSASAPLPGSVRDRFEETFGISMLETYGMTEASGQIAANPLNERDRRAGSVGLPVGVAVRVVDDEGNQLGPDETGSIEIHGPDVIECYLDVDRRPIQARNGEGWFQTGDIGRFDGDGYLYLEGRADDVINRGGEKIYPRQIEEVLLLDPRVAKAAVVGRPHPLLGNEVVAFVELKRAFYKDVSSLPEDLLTRTGKALSRPKQPARIVILDSLPTGLTGKLLKPPLRACTAAATDSLQITSTSRVRTAS